VNGAIAVISNHITRLSGVFTERFRCHPNRGLTYDARRAVFYTDECSHGVIDIRPSSGATDARWCGGTVQSRRPWMASWAAHKANGPGEASRNSAAIEARGECVTIDGVHARNVSDGVRLVDARDWRIERCWLDYIRDDAIENDHLSSGIVHDCLLDGVYSAFSARPPRGHLDAEAAGSVLTVDSCLVRLEPQPYPHKWETKPGVVTTGGIPYSHGPFFKRRRDGSGRDDLRYRLRWSVFLAQHCGAAGIDFPPDELLDECIGVTVIWLGEGEYPGQLPSAGVRLVTGDLGRAEWAACVQDWHRRNPYVGVACKPLRWRGRLESAL